MFWTAELIVGPQRISSVYRRRSTAHVDRKRDGLRDLFAGGSVLWALSCGRRRNRRNEPRCRSRAPSVPCFRIDRFGGGCCRRKSAERLSSSRARLVDQPYAGHHIVGDLCKVLAHIPLLSMNSRSSRRSDSSNHGKSQRAGSADGENNNARHDHGIDSPIDDHEARAQRHRFAQS